MGFVQRNPATDKADFPTAAGENNGEIPTITLRENTVDKRPNPSGPSTPAPGHASDIARVCILLQLMGPVLMILTGVHEPDVTSNIPNKEPDRAAHDLRTCSQSEPQYRGEREDQRAAAEGPSEVPPVYISGNDNIGGDAHDAIRQWTSQGGCQ